MEKRRVIERVSESARARERDSKKESKEQKINLSRTWPDFVSETVFVHAFGES